MKIRIGFVSNSSSSSFILSTEEEYPEVTVILKVRISDFVKNSISTEEELDAFFIDRHGFRDSTIEDVLQDKYVKENYNQCLDEINSGRKILYGQVRNSDSSIVGRYLFDNGFKETVLNTGTKIIQDCEY